MAEYVLTQRGVPLVDPESGKAAYYPEEQAVKLLGQGWQATTGRAMLAQDEAEREKAYYDRPLEAGIQGVLRGATFGLSDVIGQAVAGKGRGGWEGKELREASPVAAGLGEFGGALATGFIPGSPVALLGRAGAAVGAGTKAALGGERLAGAAGILARGAVEGAGFGVGSGISEEALADRPTTAATLASTIGRDLVHGAVLGAGLSGVVGGLAGAGKWALDKAGIGTKARGMLERQGQMVEELKAKGDARAAELETLKGRAFGPEGVQQLKTTLAQIEGEVAAGAKAQSRLGEVGMPTAAAEEADRLLIANLQIQAIRDHKAALAPIAIEKAQAAAEAKALRVQLREGSKPGAAEVSAAREEALANPELAKAARDAAALRAKHPDIPTLPDRTEAILDAARANPEKWLPEIVEAASAKPTWEGKISSLYKQRELPDGRVVGIGKVSGNKTSDHITRLQALESNPSLGLSSYGQAGADLAGVEYAVLHAGRKATKEWSFEAALAAAEQRVEGSAVAGEAGSAVGQELSAEARKELKSALAEADLRRMKADAHIADLKARALADGINPAQEASLLDLQRRAIRGAGREPEYQQALRALEEQQELAGRIKLLEKPGAAEAALQNELASLTEQMGRGKAGLAGRVVSRAGTWGGTRMIAQALSGTAAGRRGGARDIIAGSIGLEVSRALVPKLLGGLTDLVSPGAQAASRIVEGVSNLSRPIGRALREPAMQAAVNYLTAPELKAVVDDLKMPPAMYDMTARAALSGQPEDVVKNVVAQHMKQRDFLLSKLPRDPRQPVLPPGAVQIPTTTKWKPNPIDEQRFGRYVRGAMHWKNTIEDLVALRATPESMEAMRAVYPEVAESLKQFVANAVRETAAAGRGYGPREAQQLDLVMGPPYQTMQNAGMFQRTFAAQQRQMPPRSPGGAALTLSRNNMNQLELAQSRQGR